MIMFINYFKTVSYAVVVGTDVEISENQNSNDIFFSMRLVASPSITTAVIEGILVKKITKLRKCDLGNTHSVKVFTFSNQNFQRSRLFIVHILK